MRLALIILIIFHFFSTKAIDLEYALADTIITPLEASELEYQPLSSDQLDFGYFKHYVWLRFKLHPDHFERSFFYFDQFYVEAFHMFSQHDSDLRLVGSAGSKYPVKRQYFSPIAQRGHVIPFIAKPSENTYYISFQSIYSPIRGDIEILKNSEQLASYKGDTVWLLIFGAMAFAALVALVFFAMNRLTIFLIYAFFILTNLLNLAAIRGFLAPYEFLFEFFPYDTRALLNAILLIATLTYVIAVVPKEYSPKILRHSMVVVIVLATLITLITLVLPGSTKAYHFLVFAFKPLIFYSFLIPLLYFYLSYRKGHQLSIWFVAGYAVLMSSGIMHMFQSLGLMSYGKFNGIWEIGIVLELLVFTVAFAVDYRNAFEERLRLAQVINTERVAYLQKYYQAQEDERRNISQLIHDGVLQDLNVVRMHLNEMETPDTIEKLDTSIHDLRSLSHKLMPKDLQIASLDKAMHELLKRSMETTNISWSFNAYNLKSFLSEEVRLNLYRIMQELVNNALKHSQCTELKVMLYEAGSFIILVVEDNGIGYSGTGTDGIGMQSINIRLETLHGDLKIESEPGKGTLHTLRIPV